MVFDHGINFCISSAPAQKHSRISIVHNAALHIFSAMRDFPRAIKWLLRYSATA
jgi:hypothetical protein